MNAQAANVWPEQRRRKDGDNRDTHQQFDQVDSSRSSRAEMIPPAL